jgi:hypothetical protein
MCSGVDGTEVPMASGVGDETGRTAAGESRRRAGDVDDRTEYLDARIRELGHLRQAAFHQARVYRRKGQLVPGSLREEIAENERALLQAIESYSELQ